MNQLVVLRHAAPLDHGGAFFLRNDPRFDALQDVGHSVLPGLTQGASEAVKRAFEFAASCG